MTPDEPGKTSLAENMRHLNRNIRVVFDHQGMTKTREGTPLVLFADRQPTCHTVGMRDIDKA